MDLLPALCGGGGPLALLQRDALRPAGAVRHDLLPDGLAETVPQVPAVADLDRAGQRLADRLAVSARAVAADDLDAGMVLQPFLSDLGGAAGDDVDAAAGLGVDEHGRVDLAAAQREVDPEHPRHRHLGQGDLKQDPQRGMPGDPDAQRRQQPRRGSAR
jgi:hypothetical protein